MTDYTDPTGPDEIVSELGHGPHDPPRSRRGAAVGLLTIGGLAAAGAALYVSNSAGATPSSSSTSPTSSTASSSTAAGASAAGASASASASACPQPGANAGPRGGPGQGGRRGGPGGPGADGLITGVSSTSLTVRDLFGTSHTYKVASTTTIHSGPAGSIKLSTLSRGEHVIVRTTSSTSTAADIDVHPAAIDGAVTSLTGSQITVTDRDGFSRTIDTNGQTTYFLDASSATRSKVKAGSVVHAEGTVDANGTALDADRVDVRTAAPAKVAAPARCAPVGPHGAARGPQHGRPGVPAPTGSQPATPAPTPSSAPSGTTSR